MTIDDLKALEAKTTPGPWTVDTYMVDAEPFQIADCDWDTDPPFIAALRNLAPEIMGLCESVDILCNPPSDLPTMDLLQFAVVKNALGAFNAKLAQL